MRNVIVVGLLVILALSLMITGTTLAQGGEDETDTATVWLGISLDETDDGVTVKRVTTGSPAEEGGLLVGDVIVSIDDQAIESADALTEVIQAHQPGDVISVTVTRSDNELTLEIELGSSPERHRDEPAADSAPLVMAERVLHVELDAVDNGYQVLASETRSEDVLAVDDVITAVNGTPVAEVGWQTLLSELADQDDPVLTLTVLRGGEEISVDIEQIGGLRGRHDPAESGRDDFEGRDRPGGHGSHDFQSGTAPHPVEAGMMCDQCHDTGSAEPAGSQS